MDANAGILTAAKLMDADPPWMEIHCAAWGGIVRLARLTPQAKLTLALAAAGLVKGDDGRVQLMDEENWPFAVDLVAASIVDAEGILQFAEPGPKTWLAGEISAVMELFPHATALNRMGDQQRSADAAAAKKN